MDLTQVVEGVTLTKVVKIAPDADSKKEGIFKTVTLNVKYDGLTLGSVFAKALAKDVIAWQDGVGRPKYDRINDKAMINIDARAPGKAPDVDPLDAIIAGAKVAGMSPEEYLRAEIAKRM